MDRYMVNCGELSEIVEANGADEAGAKALAQAKETKVLLDYELPRLGAMVEVVQIAAEPVYAPLSVVVGKASGGGS